MFLSHVFFLIEYVIIIKVISPAINVCDKYFDFLMFSFKAMSERELIMLKKIKIKKIEMP